MLCDKQPFTLEETLASLDFFIDEYFFPHNMWFGKTDHGDLADQENPLITERQINLYRFVHIVYPYVYDKTYQLKEGDFRYDPAFAYPHFEEPQELLVAVVQLYAFWMTFYGNDFQGNPYSDPQAEPFTKLVLDAYLRYRVDFAWTGSFTPPSRDMKSDEDAASAYFAYGELVHLSGKKGSTLRRLATANLSTEMQRHHNKGKSKTMYATGMILPEYAKPFFEGKVSRGIKAVLAHKDVLPFLSLHGTYQPTQFTPSANEPFPSYTDSTKIHAAISGWMKTCRKSARIEDLLRYISAAGMDAEGQYPFWTGMRTGKARLNLATLALINNYMTEVQGGADSDNPWQPLWDAYQHA